MNPAIEARQTGDGSYTLFDANSGECFHSHKGALTESEFVFVGASHLQSYLQAAKLAGESLAIVEMGLGTGLNYLLSASAAQQQGVPLHYHALEIKLLDEHTLASLHYDRIANLADLCAEYSELMRQCQHLGEGTHRLDTSTGTLSIYLGDALQVQLPPQHFSICYFDAFSPNSAPLLWQRSQLLKFYESLKVGGTWVTYCARGSVRKDLIACGFEVKHLPGPPGKREMLRAIRRKIGEST